MDTNQLSLCDKRKRKRKLTNKEQNDHFSNTGRQTYKFVEQSKENYKNSVRSLRTSTKIGRLFKIFI